MVGLAFDHSTTCPVTVDTSKAPGETAGASIRRTVYNRREPIFGWWSMPWVTSCARRRHWWLGHFKLNGTRLMRERAILEKMARAKRGLARREINAPFS